MNVKKNAVKLQEQMKSEGWNATREWLRMKCRQRKVRFEVAHFQKIPAAAEIQGLHEGLLNWRYYAYLQAQFQDILANVHPVDEITIQPPKIIWWCWLQGLEQAPDLCKACLASLRRNFPDYEIRTVSLDNMNDYVAIPDDIVTKFRRGEMGAAHFSDILRTFLLVAHGGIWIDSTVYASHRPDEAVLRSPLFFYSTYMRQDLSMAGSSWLISSINSHPVLVLVQKLLLEYWQRYDWNVHYFIFHFFFHMALEKHKKLWDGVPLYSNIPPHIMQNELFYPFHEDRFRQLENMSAFHKLTHHKETYPDGDLSRTNYGHIVAKYKERDVVEQ